MTQLPAAEEALVRGLLGAWPLGEPLGVQRVLGGATNRVYRVETARDLAFLRVYKRAERALAEREHALIGHVRAQGLPAVPPRPHRFGGTVFEQAGSVCALYEPAPGQQRIGPQLSAEQASGADPEDQDEYRAKNVFWVPPEARWQHLKAQARQPTIGQLVDDLDGTLQSAPGYMRTTHESLTASVSSMASIVAYSCGQPEGAAACMQETQPGFQWAIDAIKFFAKRGNEGA